MRANILHKVRDKLRDYTIYYKTIDTLKKLNSLRNRSDSELRKYYSSCELSLPKDSRWRHFRFFLQNGKVVKIKDQIRNIETLRKYLIQYTPTAVFYSTSTWLNPRNIGAKPTNRPDSSSSSSLTEHLFLHNDLIFDIDSVDLDNARKCALELIRYMRSKDYKIVDIRFSGSKGFHIEFEDKPLPSIPHPTEREEYIKNFRNALIEEIFKHFDENKIPNFIDKNVTINTRNIIRLPNSVNSNSGYICRIISEETLNKPVKKMLEETLRIKTNPKNIEAEPRLMRDMRMNLDNKSKNIKEYNALYVSNKVYGINDRYVIFLRYRSHILPIVIDDLKNLQSSFRLTDIYLFKTDVKDEYYAVSLKTVSKASLQKIINRSLSIRYKTMPAFLRVSQKFIGDKNILSLRYIKTLVSKKNDDFFVSQAHKKIFGLVIGKNLNYSRVHGNHLLLYDNHVLNGRIVSKEKMSKTSFSAKIEKYL